MCVWYGNDNTGRHLRDSYTDALILFCILVCGSWVFCILLQCCLLIDCGYKGCPRSFAQHNFFIAIIYCIIILTLSYQIRRTSVYYTPRLSTYCLRQLQQPCAPARNKDMYSPLVPIWILYFQPLVHFFNNLLAITLEPLPRDGIFQGSREVMGLARSRLYDRWGRIVHMSCVIASYVFKLCVYNLSRWRRISANFCEFECFWNYVVRMARNHRILHMPMEWMNESVGKHKHLYQDARCKNKDCRCWIHV